MSRFFASLALLLAASAAAHAAPPGTMSIRWHGQSFFELTTTKGTNIVFDPHAIEEYPRVAVKADLLLMSHLHDDHTQTHVVENLKDLEKNGLAINALKKTGDMMQEFVPVKDKQVKDVTIRNVLVYHDDSNGHKRGKNGVWIIEADGLKIVFLGDLGHLLTEDQIKKIGDVDILFVPVGGVYTINGIEAQKVAGLDPNTKQLKPKHYVIPMHYGTKVYDNLLRINSFIDDIPETQIKRTLGNELQIDPAEKAKETPIIAILGYEKLGSSR
jgi:L-ascorbate metabolism protein UlaG (beta-lactamase superfamily)